MAPTACMCSEDKEAHALLIPFPLQGHVTPLLQLAKTLAAQGLLVTFVNTNQRSHERIALNGASPRPNKLRFVLLPDGLAPSFHDSDLKPHLRAYDQALEKLGNGPLQDLVYSLALRGPPVSCIIAGSFLPWIPHVAKKLRIPFVSFWTQSAAVFSTYYHAFPHGFFPLDENAKEPPKVVIASIPGVPPLQTSDIPTFLNTTDTSAHTFQLFKCQFDNMRQADWILINSFYELEKDVFEALRKESLNIVSVGPLLPSAFLDGRDVKDTSVGASLLQESHDCVQWLDRRPPASVVYISFGSLSQPSREQLQEIAFGLQASQQHFLWSFRPDSEIENLSTILPVEYLEETKEQGLIVPWTPQLKVLSHPSLAAFMTHCGWNSTLESISLGVPLLPIFALFSDQTTSRKYVTDVWKVGLDFKRQDDGLVGRDEVERIVRKMVQGNEGKMMRERVVQLSKAARKAVQAEGSSHVQMNKFLQAMKP